MIPKKNPHFVIRGPFCLKAALAGLAWIVLPAISGCTYLPSSGPSADRINSNAGNAYELIPITSNVVKTLRDSGNPQRRNDLGKLNPSQGSSLQQGSPIKFRYSVPGVNKLPPAASPTIAVGDVIHVTIYDAGGGLFGSAIPAAGASKGGSIGGMGSSGNQLPSQSVDVSGEITMPYGGRIPVKGRSPHEVELEIVNRLKGKAVDPQVIVTVGDRIGGNLVTVTGDVRNPREVPMGYAGTRLLDALTTSGGSIGKPHETIVSVVRGSQSRADFLAAVLNDPAKNVALQPGDTVIVKNQPRTFLAFGATGRNGRFALETDQVSLAEAMAQSSGPMDSRSNPSAIYLYRLEPRSLVRKLGHTPKELFGGESRVIYKLNVVEPEGFFLARNFEVQDKDIIFFANAGSVGLNKFLGLLSTVTTGARGAIGIEAAIAQ